jgi:hypothetical protein
MGSDDRDGESERDQECGKSLLNGTALGTWAFNQRHSCPVRRTSAIRRRKARETMPGEGSSTGR